MRALRSRRELLSLGWSRAQGHSPTGTGSRAVAVIDPELCLGWYGGGCYLCESFCPRPGAITRRPGTGPVIDQLTCDGCGLCLPACEAAGSPGAIRLEASFRESGAE